MQDRTEEERRTSFQQINANCAIEGQIMDVADLAVQERIIRGEVSHETAVTDACLVREQGGLP